MPDEPPPHQPVRAEITLSFSVTIDDIVELAAFTRNVRERLAEDGVDLTEQTFWGADDRPMTALVVEGLAAVVLDAAGGLVASAPGVAEADGTQEVAFDDSQVLLVLWGSGKSGLSAGAAWMLLSTIEQFGPAGGSGELPPALRELRYGLLNKAGVFADLREPIEHPDEVDTARYLIAIAELARERLSASRSTRFAPLPLDVDQVTAELAVLIDMTGFRAPMLDVEDLTRDPLGLLGRPSGAGNHDLVGLLAWASTGELVSVPLGLITDVIGALKYFADVIRPLRSVPKGVEAAVLRLTTELQGARKRALVDAGLLEQVYVALAAYASVSSDRRAPDLANRLGELLPPATDRRRVGQDIAALVEVVNA